MIWFRRSLRSQKGVALIAVMLALLVLSLIVSAMVFMTMGETSMSLGNLHNQQALAAAEAGAFRMLADFRHRVSSDRVDVESDLSQQLALQGVSDTTLNSICSGTGPSDPRPLSILTSYAYPTTGNTWRRVGDLAILDLGTSTTPIVITDSSTGTTVASFYATLYVRESANPLRQPSCEQNGEDSRFEMWFDYAIVSTGRSANAVKTVCLRNFRQPHPSFTAPFRCADLLTADVSSSARGFEVPVLVQREPVTRYAAMLLWSVSDPGPPPANAASFYTGAILNGKVHSNSRLRITGNPVFNAPVTQYEPDMLFSGCGSDTNITIVDDASTDPNSYLFVNGCDLPRFNSTVMRSTRREDASGTNPARAAVGMAPFDGNGEPAANEGVAVRSATNDDAYAGVPLRDGVYVMDACPLASCGIYVRGDIRQMVLRSENGRQVILLTQDSSWDQDQRYQKIIIDPGSGTVQRCWSPSGVDPSQGNCAGWTSSRTYPGFRFNGVFYVDGNIRELPAQGGSSGLYGMVNSNTRLTIAADRDIHITDHLIYETPPAGPGHKPTNVLAVWSRHGDVMIINSLAPDNVYIDAAVLAPHGQFRVEGWDALPARGNVYFLGSTVQYSFGPFGGFSPETGYGRVMGFDWRLASDVVPPFIPKSQHFISLRDASIAVQRLPDGSLGDPLYFRPEWEEMIGI